MITSVVKLNMPARAEWLRLHVQDIAKQEGVDFQLDEIASALDAFSSVVGELANANKRLRERDDLTEGDAVLCGETLQTALIGVEALLHLCSRNEHRPLAVAVRDARAAYEATL